MKPIETEINGRKFYIYKMDAFTALKTFGDLQKQLLPSVGALVGGDGEASIEDAIRSFSESLDGVSLEKWCKRLMTDESVSYVDDDGEAHKLTDSAKNMVFADFGEILELLIAIIMENFRDPLLRLLNRSGLGDKLKAVKV